MLDEGVARCGAVIAGRRTYDVPGAWGGEGPCPGLPLFVLTHCAPAPAPAAQPPYTNVTGGIEQAVDQAQAAAAGKDVVLMGAAAVQQCLEAGLLDQLVINLVPIVLGRGVRLLDDLQLVDLDLTTVIDAPDIHAGRGGGLPLNIRQPDESLAYVLADSGAAGMLVSDELTERAETLRPAAGGGFCAGTSELQDAAPLADCPAVGLDDVCMQPYTSGSTGKPKGVLLTHRGQIWCADVVRKCFMTDETEVALLAAPLYHKNAAVTLKVFLLAGGCCVVLPGFESSAVIEAIDTYKITYLSGSIATRPGDESARC